MIVTDDMRTDKTLWLAVIAQALTDGRLDGAKTIELVCQPDVEPFYERWGFTTRVGRSRLMRRIWTSPMRVSIWSIRTASCTTRRTPCEPSKKFIVCYVQAGAQS